MINDASLLSRPHVREFMEVNTISEDTVLSPRDVLALQRDILELIEEVQRESDRADLAEINLTCAEKTRHLLEAQVKEYKSLTETLVEKGLELAEEQIEENLKKAEEQSEQNLKLAEERYKEDSQLADERYEEGMRFADERYEDDMKLSKERAKEGMKLADERYEDGMRLSEERAEEDQQLFEEAVNRAVEDVHVQLQAELQADLQAGLQRIRKYQRHSRDDCEWTDRFTSFVSADEPHAKSSGSHLARGEPSFLGIPREIRDEIHKLVLLKYKVIYPHGFGGLSVYDPKGFRKPPEIAVLLVNRQLNVEGTEILYGKGCFGFSTGDKFDRFFGTNVSRNTDRIFPSRHLIQNVELSFTRGDLSMEALGTLSRSSWADPSLGFNKRLKYVHNGARQSYEAAWEDNIRVLEAMRGLKNLTVDINGLFCPIGCCRMLECFAAMIVGLGHKKLQIGIRGQVMEGENATIAKILNAIGPAKATALD